MVKKKKNISQSKIKPNPKKYPTLKLKNERDIAMDFAEKVYEKFDKLVKSIILFGSSIKKTKVIGSDIDIIIIVDNAIVNFDEKLITWYREELGKIIQSNPYNQDLHINTIKLTTWWEDLQRGDPVVINIVRYGESLIDFGGFFDPFKILLQEGKIKTTRESIYTTLNRVPGHIVNSRIAELSAIEGCYWAMVEASQALLMSINVLPPSPEHITLLLKENFVNKKLMNMKYVREIETLYHLHRKIIHGEIKNLDGSVIDDFQKKADEFFKIVLKLIREIFD
jgi:predicted nucleotidyltransferase